MQAERLERKIQLVPDDARLHDRPPLPGIDFENLVPALYVHDNPLPNHLSRNGRPRRARNEAGLPAPRLPDQFHDILDRFRIGDPLRHFAVNRSVGGIGNPMKGVSKNETHNPGSQAPAEFCEGFCGGERTRTAVQTPHQAAFYTLIRPLVFVPRLPDGGRATALAFES